VAKTRRQKKQEEKENKKKKTRLVCPEARQRLFGSLAKGLTIFGSTEIIICRQTLNTKSFSSPTFPT